MWNRAPNGAKLQAQVAMHKLKEVMAPHNAHRIHAQTHAHIPVLVPSLAMNISSNSYISLD